MSARYTPLKDRFDAKWSKDQVSGCWIWLGACHVDGHGKMYLNGKLIGAHRIGWELYVGEIPRELVVDHLCRRKNCVNPAHLELVSASENVRRRNACGHSYEQLPSLRPPKKPKPTLRERFDSKWKIAPSGCWEWQMVLNVGGYGTISVNAYPRLAHRAGYELYKGKIPDGLHLDHLCCNPKCVNPDHLEPVTLQENARRGDIWKKASITKKNKPTCKRGHKLSGGNLIQTKTQRVCRECRILRKRAYNRAYGPGPNLEGLKLGAAASVVARTTATHCKNGHEFTEENTGRKPGGKYCKICVAFKANKSRENVLCHS